MLSTLMPDKEIILKDGRNISCSNLRGLYKNCKDTRKTSNSREDFCGNYYKIAFKCYTSGQMEFEDIVDKEIKDFHKFMEYLSQNKSKLPEKLIANKNINFLNYLMYDLKDSQGEENPYVKKEREEEMKMYKATMDEYKQY